ADLEPATFDGPRAEALVEVLARGERLCAAGKTLMARRVDDSRVWRNDGHRSGAHWLAAATGVSIGAATATLATATALDALPATPCHAARAYVARRARRCVPRRRSPASCGRCPVRRGAQAQYRRNLRRGSPGRPSRATRRVCRGRAGRSRLRRRAVETCRRQA